MAGHGEQKGKPLLVPIDKVVAGRGQLVVVARGSSFELIAGERRLRAAARAGLDEVPVVLREVGGDAEMLELALVENLQREDLGPLERARAYQRLCSEHGHTQDEVARKVGKSRTAVTNTMRLLALPGPVLDAIEQGLVDEGHARPLLGLPTAALQVSVLQQVVRRGLSVRETEDLVREASAEAGSDSSARKARKEKRSASPLEADLSRTLGTKVRLRGGARKGRIEIEYYSQEELTRLIDFLSSKGGL